MRCLRGCLSLIWIARGIRRRFRCRVFISEVMMISRRCQVTANMFMWMSVGKNPKTPIRVITHDPLQTILMYRRAKAVVIKMPDR